ncbi:MAG TPA: amidohydrolase [Candidatus Syntrophoarchaeum butanivorans]|uniref:Amidohydrolase n=1 Tax=Candidatus Syntropharchaeum butanivorans TaxID=1839936 RepID=A0A1F2P638_9EURY|nr:MAG: amidohydrolase 2 [Candidatus Syntrophoarchaeum butanivorans]HEC56855.1 amidohydrolase [Candidatus Syntrophoarchaeum butanivorans]
MSLIKPIDIHAHPPTEDYLIRSGGKYIKHAAEYFRISIKPRSIEEMLEAYDRAGVDRIVIVAWDAETTTGLPKTSNEYIAEIVDRYPDRFIGFASVDPWKGEIAIRDLEVAIRDLGLSGVKFQQAIQAFFPNDRRFYPIYEKCVELKIPVQFHLGMTGAGAGVRGGDGIRLKYTRPIYLDEVAADFPELTIIGLHPSWPWQEESIAIAMHKANFYLDLSGWLPTYFPETLVRYARTLLKDKCLFGTDYPFIDPERWLYSFNKLGFEDEVKELILEKNARRVLGI